MVILLKIEAIRNHVPFLDSELAGIVSTAGSMPVYLLMDVNWDVAVVGSGMGGLASAALLAEKGYKVLVLEKGNSPGGCASTFTKAGFSFESGATTLVGLEPGLPLQILSERLGIQFPVKTLNLSMLVHQGKFTVQRFPKRAEWIAECQRVFGAPKRMVFFWSLSFFISDRLWDLSRRYSFFPFQRFSDVVKTLRVFSPWDAVVLLFSLVSVRTVLFFLGLSQKSEFIRFLNEQLLITNQTTIESAPFAPAACGLTYPNLQNYIVLGGMVNLSYPLIQYVEERQGKYLSKQEVTDIQRIDDVYHITTKHRTMSKFSAKVLVSNLPIWDLARIYPSHRELSKKANLFQKGIWGAFTMGVVVPNDKIPKDLCLHHQIHLTKPLPHGGGDSIFVSFSHAEDKVRSSGGVRILSISTHIQSPELWVRGEEYRLWKKQIEERVFAALSDTFAWFSEKEVVFYHSATPVTWKTWVGRSFGRVGGIPTSYFFSPFRFLSNLDGRENLLYVGDTFYPGQGIPAVVLGARNAVERFLDRKRSC